MKITPETNKEHIDRLYKRVEDLINDFVEIQKSLDNIEASIKLLTWAQNQKGS